MADENTSNGASELPENVGSVNEAVELMSNLAEAEAEREGEREQQAPDAVDTHAAAEREGEEGEARVEAEGEGEPQDVGAPEFWSAEDKAAWAQVPAELRPLLAKYEQQRVQFVNERAREAAQFRDAVATELKKANDTVAEAAAWWQQAGPALQHAFADKWSQVNWQQLAAENPAEWARLNQLRADEAALLTEAQRRGQADIEVRHRHAVEEFQRARQVEHEKVAAALPEYFGTPELSAKTYSDLGNFLYSKGVPTERINTIYEAPIIELAVMAMRWEQTQRKASTALTGRAGEGARTTGHAAPRRVQPGPPSRGGNRGGDAVRQASERFHKSGDMRDAARLLDQLGL